jgi:hypothetical protein
MLYRDQTRSLIFYVQGMYVIRCIALICFLPLGISAADSNLYSQQRSFKHPLTIEQLKHFVRNGTILDMRNHKKLFCPKRCCAIRFLVLTIFYPNLALNSPFNARGDRELLKNIRFSSHSSINILPRKSNLQTEIPIIKEHKPFE